MHDVIIVGAGPSGAYLGYMLARDGYDVLMVDKETFPREKVCGGGISNKTVELLEFDISSVVERRIVGAYLTYQNRDTVVKDIEGRSGVTVTRSKFDALILEHASKKGVTFVEGCKFLGSEIKPDHVSVSTSAGVFSAKYLVGADGVFSHVRNTLFDQKLVTYAPSLEALVYVPQSVIDRFENRTLLDFGGTRRGYGWIFPKKDHLNVGVFSIFGSKNIKVELERFMSRYATLQNPARIIYRGFAIPLSNRKHIYQKGRVLLLGDAAGFAESFYGEGIYFALKSAVLAHRALSSSFDNPGGCEYSRLVSAEMLADMAYSMLNAKFFFPIQKFGYYQMVRNEHVNYYFAEIIAGHVSYKECFYKTLFTSPYWLFSKKFPYLGKSF